MLLRVLDAEHELARSLGSHRFSAERMRTLQLLQADLHGYEQSFVEVSRIVHGPPPVDRRRAARISDAMEDSINARIVELDRSRAASAEEVLALVRRQRDRAVAFLAALVCGSLAAALAVTVVVAVAVRRLIARLARGTGAVAAGDYDHAIPLGSDPELNGLYGQFNDMAARLKELEQLRTDFVSMLSHDLKSPLSVIRMYADALAARPGAEREADAISRSAERLLRLVGNILDASRAGAAPLAPVLRPLELAPLLARVCEDGALLARSHEVSVHAEIETGLPAVGADEGLLERALHNLVSNAVKFNRPRGRVTLRALRRGERVRLEVADTGLGISEADRQRLFEKYFRAERTRHIRGTGLGLAATREIVRAHGGELEIASREGEGTVFAFELPAAPTPPATPAT
jgi:signal transduction histidine kinase